jgi:CRP/FNR family transcriptional regulator, dissimilatory nitrate respiration regulator
MTKLSPRTAEILKRNPLFSTLDAAGVERFLAGSSEIDVPRATILRRRGEKCSAVYVVIRGRIKLSLETQTGGEKVISLLGPHARFGEALVYCEEPSLGTVEALVDSTVACIPRDVLFHEIDTNPRFAHYVIKDLGRRIYQRAKDIENYTLRNGTERLVEYLLSEEPEQVINGARHVIFSERKGIIASRLNLTQEHFSRILRDLAERKLIQVDGAHVVIPDVELLRSVQI